MGRGACGGTDFDDWVRGKLAYTSEELGYALTALIRAGRLQIFCYELDAERGIEFGFSVP